uniref:G_PROTEIN_RECEP_F1_2 domain-containing protein n=3 Tax=Caenorhabditis tropicalis TaxID=1561998 RepID=A0A1I7T6R7_9PELO
MSDDYSSSLFSDFDSEEQKYWLEVLDVVDSICNNLQYTTLIVSIIGIVCNLFHLLVLSQKSMRGLTINAFLIGIGLCDLIRMTCVVLIVGPYINAYLQTVPLGCLGPPLYITMVISVFGNSTEKTCQQLSVWYGVTIGVLRALVIRYPLNSKISRFINSKYGCRPLLLITAIAIPFWVIGYSQLHVKEYRIWKAPVDCPNFPANYTQVEYFFDTIKIFGQSDLELFKIALVFEGITCKLIPSVLLPLATIFLVIELKKNKSESTVSSKTSDSSKRSTKLVIFMTISFLIANFPLGVLYLAEFCVYNDGPMGFVYIMKRCTAVFTLINVINGTVHFLICFFMSSHYRTTAKSLVTGRAVQGSSVVNPTEVPAPKIESAKSTRSIFAIASTKVE